MGPGHPIGRLDDDARIHSNRSIPAGESPTRLCAAIARRGHLGLLRWAISNHAPYAWDAADAAAEGGHLDVMDYLWSMLDPGSSRRGRDGRDGPARARPAAATSVC